MLMLSGQGVRLSMSSWGTVDAVARSGEMIRTRRAKSTAATATAVASERRMRPGRRVMVRVSFTSRSRRRPNDAVVRWYPRARSRTRPGLPDDLSRYIVTASRNVERIRHARTTRITLGTPLRASRPPPRDGRGDGRADARRLRSRDGAVAATVDPVGAPGAATSARHCSSSSATRQGTATTSSNGSRKPAEDGDRAPARCTRRCSSSRTKASSAPPSWRASGCTRSPTTAEPTRPVASRKQAAPPGRTPVRRRATVSSAKPSSR